MCVCALGVVPVVGCGDATGGGGGGGSAGSGGSNTASLSLFIRHWDPDTGVGGVLDGVQVCETETTNCEVTDANGQTTLDLLADQETGFTLDRVDYASYLESTVVPAGGSMLSEFMATDQYAVLVCGF
ncbi:MAG: hypothetical protein OER77_00825 [Myxococcales bacterium]|nr:hypothetical protein [Myxococcales bacterium]